MKFIAIPEDLIKYIDLEKGIIEIVEGGIMVFESEDEHQTWLNQK